MGQFVVTKITLTFFFLFFFYHFFHALFLLICVNQEKKNTYLKINK
jgi:hypothetical protein